MQVLILGGLSVNFGKSGGTQWPAAPIIGRLVAAVERNDPEQRTKFEKMKPRAGGWISTCSIRRLRDRVPEGGKGLGNEAVQGLPRLRTSDPAILASLNPSKRKSEDCVR